MQATNLAGSLRYRLPARLGFSAKRRQKMAIERKRVKSGFCHIRGAGRNTNTNINKIWPEPGKLCGVTNGVACHAFG